MPKFMLDTSHWYGWQMVPGYAGERNVPYFSPMYLRAFAPRKTGRRELHVEFLNAQYAEGVQEFSIDLKILKHSQDYLVAEIAYVDVSVDRVAVISRIEFEWIRRCCPEIWAAQPPASFGSIEQNSVSYYLHAVFGTSPDE